MLKNEYLAKLKTELQKLNVVDIEEIVEEYNQHFIYKISDGYTEEEIAEKLGSPKEIASQYGEMPSERKKSGKLAMTCFLGLVDFFFGMMSVLLYAWEIILGAFAIVCIAIAFGLATSIRTSVFGLIPSMPYHCAVIFALSFAALCVITLVYIIYFFGLIRQLTLAFCRYQRNKKAQASGRAILPPLPISPKFTPVFRRKIRKCFLCSVIIFIICFLAGWIISSLTAGAIEFWHVWQWFQ